MLRVKFHRKICAMAMLTAFCTLIFISQTAILKINNSKNFKTAIAKSATGAGSSNKESQSNPVNNAEEEEDDEIKIALDLIELSPIEFFAIKYLTLKERTNSDPPRRIISPPPRF